MKTTNLIGAKLPNGATILALYHGPASGIVLADNGREFVTWEFYRQDLASTSHGHYISNRADAADDFSDRVNKLIKNLRYVLDDRQEGV